RGAITLIQEENNKVTHNLERGDIIRVRAGTIVSMVNRDSNEKLYVVTLIQPVSTPGKFEAFYGPGSRDQESIYNAFSKEILQAAFNTPSDQLSRLFEGERNQGGFVKASREQIQALSGRSSKQGPWPFRHGGESQSNRPYNLLNQRPLLSNQYGQLYKANPDDYEELQELDVAVSLANITEGAIFGPYYNSRSTKIVMVNGNGCFELACPHLSRQQGQQGRQQSGSTYQQVRACVSSGDVFVVPAGHPVVIVASTDQNLEVACFEIKAENNQMYALAGKNNILKQLQRELKELSFNVPARQVEEIFNKQQESWFYPGPEQRQQHDGHPSA
ncbi:Conglutin beta, partial [Thalictrum thalictroides]